MDRRLVVVGGGAAGIFSAIRAGEVFPDLKIKILEAQSRPLGKVRISGGGRCNVTHHCFDNRALVSSYPRGSKELLSSFSRFSVADTIAWFRDRSVELKVEEDGRMFPVSDSSETIIHCLLEEAKRRRISIEYSQPVKSIKSLNGSFLLSSRHKDFEADAVILATGGLRSSYQLVGDLGHKIIPPVPSLFSFEIDDAELVKLQGLSFKKVHARLKVMNSEFSQLDPFVITHWGVSGPLVIRLSAWAARELFQSNYKAKLFFDFLPDRSSQEVVDIFYQEKEVRFKMKVSNSTVSQLPRRFWEHCLKKLSLTDKKWAELSKREIQDLVGCLKSFPLDVIGKGIFKEEFVTCGGVDRREVDFKTFQSRLLPGLFLAGELIDVDGITGGFNFQFAWTSAYLAGGAAAEYCHKKSD